MKLAIVIGVSEYDHCQQLVACKNDMETMAGILARLNKFDEICSLSGTVKAYEAKQKISEFVDKHKSSDVDEFLFYFSGHGARYDEDFFYVFSDFSESKKEASGLRNTELDGLIRNLTPDLTVKIIDACYSGSTYLKSDIDIEPILQKSAKQNELKKLYFMHSSSSEEESIATREYSVFSKSLFASLPKEKGSGRLIRHFKFKALLVRGLFM